jgi:regulator of protease activity HflC (stomatin/prohibitin superfamily)/DNA-directed RNA polymerase subunit RPC12/RpoP
MAVVFRCDHCGMGLQAGDKQRNTVVSCPKCKSAILVPSSVNDLPRSGADSHNSDDGTSSSILAVVLIAVAAPVVIVLLLLLIYRPLVFAISCLALLALVAVGVLHVLWAKSQAFGKHRHDVPLFFGLVRLVVWEPTEGVVLLKNKQITYVDNNIEDGGGVKFIFPILGHEVGLAAPLTVLPVQFEDANVYTRDSIPLSMKMTIWWKIHDLRKFYLSISQEVHTLTDRGRHSVATNNTDGFHDPLVTQRDRQRLEAAERWITASAEEETRAYACGISTSLLVAEQIAASLPMANAGQITAEQADGSRGQLAVPAHGGAVEASLGMYQTATGALSERLQSKLNSVLGTKGLEIDRIALQEVGLPPEVRKKAIDAAAAWYGVIEARRKGVGAAAKIDELAKVIGKDAAATAEILKHYQGINIGVGLTGLLDQVFANFTQAGTGTRE